MPLPTRLVVPLDGSPQPNAALPLATGLARALNVPLHVVRFVERQADVLAAEQQLASVSHEVGRNAVAVERRVMIGEPAAALVDTLRVDDLVVLGLAGRADFGRLTRALVERWDGPVVLRRAGGRRVLHVRSIGACAADAPVALGSALADQLGLELCLLATLDPACFNVVDLAVADRSLAELALDPAYEPPLLVVGNA